ncbi:SapC family protein [Gilvimarinus agarilyticus]|uniref:SapC family protein n=1 Tax=Gilvimarinus sp. 2_MG-2023 TaxID=3062666 RepID=UPI001C08FB9D|nr:SapC family protein [Gilvimarinus sp. 2_MG-2023]MBU2887749.1 SapC family protein [Gilvimarinus agarilyticus]MDO6572397.1 SapC family protein [Gilvimarinus sp. 2_MG-2023]
MRHATEILDSKKHQHLHIINNRWSDACYQADNVNVVMSELQNLVHDYPIFIAKNPNTGQFQLRALLGLKGGVNLYVKDGQWRAHCFPLDILSRPFRLFMPESDNMETGAIAIDPGSALISENEGEPLFQADGSASARLQRINQIFSALVNGQQQSAEFLQRLHQLGLIEPVSINLTLKNLPNAAIDGLYGINEDKLSALPSEALIECHKNGDLYAVHLMLSSSVHIEKLARWYEEQESDL